MFLFFHKQKNDNSEDDEMLNNLPQMLGIEPSMILLNHMDSDGMEDGGRCAQRCAWPSPTTGPHSDRACST